MSRSLDLQQNVSRSLYLSKSIDKSVAVKTNNDFSIGEVLDFVDSDISNEENTFQRGLKSRHIQLIALGGAIGTGLFIGSGSALATCGPAPLLISYIIMACMIWSIMNQLSEMVTLIPLPGEATLYGLARKYSSESISFTAGWNLYYAQAMVAPAEITACALLVSYWTTANSAIFISIFCFFTIAVNCAPVKFFGESEFWIASIKIACIVGLIIVGVVIFFGGGPDQTEILGFHYWNNPGAFVEHIKPGNTGKFLACWTAIIKSGFSFVMCPELITSCSAESQNPRKNIPKACDRFVYRLIVFYIFGVLVVGIVVASNNDNLMGAINSGKSTASASPFVIGIESVGIKVLPHIINACILTSAYSAGTSMLYGASRSLYAMAVKGDAPRIFSEVNRFGVPIYSVGVSSLFPVLAYLNCSNTASQVFTWFSNLATISGFISWVFVSITYLRYRKVLDCQNLNDRVPYRPKFQIFGCYMSILVFSLLSLTNGYAIFFPSLWSTSDFFAAYVTILIILILYVGAVVVKREWKLFYDPEKVDILDQIDQCEAEAILEVEAQPANILEKIWFYIA